MLSIFQKHILFGYDQELVYEGFRRVIVSKTKHKVIGGWQNGVNFLEKTKPVYSDLIILEFGNPSKCHLEYLHTILKIYNSEKIIIISSSIGFSMMNEILELDIGGMIFKDSNTNEFITAISTVLSGQNYYCSGIAKLLLTNYKKSSAPPYKLTKRENSILPMITEGNSNEYIVNKLGISASTVKTHRRNIMSKLGAKNSIDLFKIVCKDKHLFHIKSAFCKDCPYNLRGN